MSVLPRRQRFSSSSASYSQQNVSVTNDGGGGGDLIDNSSKLSSDDQLALGGSIESNEMFRNGWQQKHNYSLHKARLDAMKGSGKVGFVDYQQLSNVQVRAPVIVKRKKEMLDFERQTEIERQNVILLNKISKIMLHGSSSGATAAVGIATPAVSTNTGVSRAASISSRRRKVMPITSAMCHNNQTGFTDASRVLQIPISSTFTATAVADNSFNHNSSGGNYNPNNAWAVTAHHHAHRSAVPTTLGPFDYSPVSSVQRLQSKKSLNFEKRCQESSRIAGENMHILQRIKQQRSDYCATGLARIQAEQEKNLAISSRFRRVFSASRPRINSATTRLEESNFISTPHNANGSFVKELAGDSDRGKILARSDVIDRNSVHSRSVQLQVNGSGGSGSPEKLTDSTKFTSGRRLKLFSAVQPNYSSSSNQIPRAMSLSMHNDKPQASFITTINRLARRKGDFEEWKRNSQLQGRRMQPPPQQQQSQFQQDNFFYKEGQDNGGGVANPDSAASKEEERQTGFGAAYTKSGELAREGASFEKEFENRAVVFQQQMSLGEPIGDVYLEISRAAARDCKTFRLVLDEQQADQLLATIKGNDQSRLRKVISLSENGNLILQLAQLGEVSRKREGMNNDSGFVKVEEVLRDSERTLEEGLAGQGGLTEAVSERITSNLHTEEEGYESYAHDEEEEVQHRQKSKESSDGYQEDISEELEQQGEKVEEVLIKDIDRRPLQQSSNATIQKDRALSAGERQWADERPEESSSRQESSGDQQLPRSSSDTSSETSSLHSSSDSDSSDRSSSGGQVDYFEDSEKVVEVAASVAVTSSHQSVAASEKGDDDVELQQNGAHVEGEEYLVAAVEERKEGSSIGGDEVVLHDGESSIVEVQQVEDDDNRIRSNSSSSSFVVDEDEIVEVMSRASSKLVLREEQSSAVVTGGDKEAQIELSCDGMRSKEQVQGVRRDGNSEEVINYSQAEIQTTAVEQNFQQAGLSVSIEPHQVEELEEVSDKKEKQGNLLEDQVNEDLGEVSQQNESKAVEEEIVHESHCPQDEKKDEQEIAQRSEKEIEVFKEEMNAVEETVEPFPSKEDKAEVELEETTAAVATVIAVEEQPSIGETVSEVLEVVEVLKAVVEDFQARAAAVITEDTETRVVEAVEETELQEEKQLKSQQQIDNQPQIPEEQPVANGDGVVSLPNNCEDKEQQTGLEEVIDEAQTGVVTEEPKIPADVQTEIEQDTLELQNERGSQASQLLDNQKAGEGLIPLCRSELLREEKEESPFATDKAVGDGKVQGGDVDAPTVVEEEEDTQQFKPSELKDQVADMNDNLVDGRQEVQIENEVNKEWQITALSKDHQEQLQVQEQEELQQVLEPDELKKVQETEVLQLVQEPDVLQQVSEPEVLQQVQEPEMLQQVQEQDVLAQVQELEVMQQVQEPEELASPIKVEDEEHKKLEEQVVISKEQTNSVGEQIELIEVANDKGDLLLPTCAVARVDLSDQELNSAQQLQENQIKQTLNEETRDEGVQIDLQQEEGGELAIAIQEKETIMELKEEEEIPHSQILHSAKVEEHETEKHSEEVRGQVEDREELSSVTAQSAFDKPPSEELTSLQTKDVDQIQGMVDGAANQEQSCMSLPVEAVESSDQQSVKEEVQKAPIDNEEQQINEQDQVAQVLLPVVEEEEEQAIADKQVAPADEQELRQLTIDEAAATQLGGGEEIVADLRSGDEQSIAEVIKNEQILTNETVEASQRTEELHAELVDDQIGENAVDSQCISEAAAADTSPEVLQVEVKPEGQGEQLPQEESKTTAVENASKQGEKSEDIEQSILPAAEHAPQAEAESLLKQKEDDEKGEEEEEDEVSPSLPAINQLLKGEILKTSEDRDDLKSTNEAPSQEKKEEISFTAKDQDYEKIEEPSSINGQQSKPQDNVE